MYAWFFNVHAMHIELFSVHKSLFHVHCFLYLYIIRYFMY
jgi:hypothetical protein